MALVGEVFIGSFLTICILLFGISSQSRVWMPRPDQYFLSWSFGFIILAAICSFISSGFLYCISYTDRAAQEEVEKFEAVETNYGMPSIISGRIGSGGLSAIGGAGGVVVKVPPTGARPEQVIALDSDLRRMDGGHESMSLFSPSIGMLSNNYNDNNHYNLEEHQLTNENNSQTLSPIESEHSHELSPLYVNQPTIRSHHNKHDIKQTSSSSSSSNIKSYSPLAIDNNQDDSLNTLSDNHDRQNMNIPIPRYSLPISKQHYNTTRYSRY
ncbi:PMP-22/EMP/MP20/Claudin tight junction [Schistosoma japonicum]|nr:PMP-22/EMP/MP20/Claudin tight junction [Schistosoma japonicum]KAH8857567.1 PMP-22/EMP/MP20/Claudin tight junction [Schistosoma japonicum]